MWPALSPRAFLESCDRASREEGVLQTPVPPAYSSPPNEAAKEKHALWPSEAAVSDVVGRLIEFWGFKRNMGRIWSVLYLSPEPLSALRVYLRPALDG